MSKFQIFRETAQYLKVPTSPCEEEARVTSASHKLTARQKVGLPPLISAASRCPSTVAFRHASDEMTERLNAATVA